MDGDQREQVRVESHEFSEESVIQVELNSNRFLSLIIKRINDAE